MTHGNPHGLDVVRAFEHNAKWEARERARDEAIEAEEARWYASHATCRRCQPVDQDPTTDEIVDHGCYRHADYDQLHAHYLGPDWKAIHDDRDCRVCARLSRGWR